MSFLCSLVLFRAFFCLCVCVCMWVLFSSFYFALFPLFRAPEVMLGLPLSYAIDMWGVARILLCLYFPKSIFPNCQYKVVRKILPDKSGHAVMLHQDRFKYVCLQMKRIVNFLGHPKDKLLNAGRYTDRYFIKDSSPNGSAWRLKVRHREHLRTDLYKKINK